MDFNPAVPHPVLPSTRVVGGSRENVDFKIVGKVPHTFKSNTGTSRGKRVENVPGAASLAAVLQ